MSIISDENEGQENTKDFPQEFAILTPLMDEFEQERLSEKEEQFSINDSVVKVRNFLVDFILTLSPPSKMLCYSHGKILHSVSDYDTLISFSQQYDSIVLKL